MSSSISVAVRVRPFSGKESAQLAANHNTGLALFSSDPNSSASGASTSYSTPQPPPRVGTGAGGLRKVLKVLDDRILVFDPPETNNVVSLHRQAMPHHPVMGKKVKDIRFCFDRVFDEDCGQEEVYDGSAKELVGHVMDGFHSTVFAYGATGCGKTHTISGTNSQPGIVFLIMKDLFARIAQKATDTDFSITVSYLEIYNETIRDLLCPESGPLALRESNGAASASGLSSKVPSCATEVVEWITLGNQNRTVNATEANATSSRSHAVLTVTLRQRPRGGGMTDTEQTACLSIIDLAGSERASVTKNKGERLIEGANINRSLLALGNCINALCDPRKRGHVPYRDSKLTRLLKQSLGGNCKTVMIVCVSPSSAHYDETHNTLQYANRAKEIKTKAVRNVVSVDRHVAQYCQQILEQTQQINQLRAQLELQSSSSSIASREEEGKAVERTKRRLMPLWEEGKRRLVKAENARTELAAIDTILNVLRHWKSDVLSSYEASSPATVDAASSTVAQLISAWGGLYEPLLSTSHRLASEVAAGEQAFDTYIPMHASSVTTISKEHPGALSSFNLEIEVLNATLESEKASAREAGGLEGMKVQARAMLAMTDARIKVGTALESSRDEGGVSERALRRLADGIDAANRSAFLSLSQPSSLAGQKRDQGARSPFEPQEAWTAKTPRSAATGPGSAPTGHLASPLQPFASSIRRQSPKKPVVFRARRADGSVSPKKKAKGVQWRDEETGEDLEDVKFQSPNVSYEATPESTPTSKHAMPPSPAIGINLLPSTSTKSAAEIMSASIKHRVSSASAPLRGARVSALPAVSETGKPFSFARDAGLMLPPPIPPTLSLAVPGTPLSDVGNTSVSSESSVASSSRSSSYSMAGPGGLYAPLVSKPSASASAPDTPRRAARAARRVSQIGPLRSSKSNRRTSFIPPTPLGASAKTGRLGASGKLSGSGGPPVSAARRSPKKPGIAPVRRQSLVVGPGAAPLSFAAPLPVPGSRSADRIKARRESAQAAMAQVGSSSMVPGPKRTSPSLGGVQGKGAGLWRA